MDAKKTSGTGFKLSVMTLAIMNVTAVVSLRGLPAEAVYGPSSAFYYLFAAIVFLIPTALVAAELAAMFADKQGGVFRWVGEAYGARTGFLAIWLQWIESTIWYPTVLTFGAVSIAFIGVNEAHDMTLASNKLFTLVIVLAIYWLATLISLKGLDWVGKISKWGGMIGTIIPAGLLIVLGIVYIASGGHNNMDMSQGFFPDLTKLDNLVLASGIFLFYAGMEMMGIHVMEVRNPSRNYPRAIIIGSLITVCIFVLGTFSLGFIIPAKDISLTQSLLIGFDNYFRYLHMSWASPVIAVALMFGVLAGVLTWVAGPSKGIYAVGKAGYLPPFFQKANRIGVQRNILLVQGGVVTLLALLFVVMPSVQSFYQILSQLTVLLYLIMYMLMFSAAIVLRYKLRDTPRPFRLGRGNGLMWLLGALGFCGALLAFVLSFIPPAQIQTGSSAVWYSVLIVGCIVVVAAPFVIYALRKPSWRDPQAAADFAPFHWEAAATAPKTAPTAATAPKAAPAAATTSKAAPTAATAPKAPSAAPKSTPSAPTGSSAAGNKGGHTPKQ
ncbi:putative glutamine/gamma-aminobutyrate antiporter GadC [uncultured Alistipes sp.]|mgnify:CR=1 FL=1|uniref:putative glutamine/gamma-aminobutyrate antiporter GadC n=1 Tax=uncultured Alistipes sp. TaxID=538949 RepID=UPI002600DDB9|nr:putative glutamine/gamma-aminobutyrate antiporter GadC [uncultured Alistipes sp.]